MRLYINQPLANITHLTIGESSFNHAVRVMRKKTGDRLTLFNGQGGEYQATIAVIDKRSMRVIIEQFIPIERESSLKIHLIQSIAKGERMDFIMQKSVELGVVSITPLMSVRSVVMLNDQRTQKRMQHWQGIIESACAQSGRNICPVLYEPTDSKTFATKLLPHPHLLFSPTAPHTLGTILHKMQPIPAEIAIIIGPEGGFSPQEHTLFTQQNISPIALGRRILRTETAALSIMGALHGLIGDWQ